ncbi:probable WRKY transcription factor 3 [Ziziphus jujuba]|uniref:Probable WRKY transcription factor 3 n=1 Tax=Ziziphus jujuba TaxID=326968 RepID=A0ABM3I223_ZIZJJ|nr:probable WRKY transcription factor 3 [Ziziphus jujuba]
MAGNADRPPSSKSSPPSKSSSSSAAPSRPTIALPPRSSFEALFNGGGGGGVGGPGMGFSPGPMTLVSNFFAENDEFKSFSQLLAGAMASPAARPNFQSPPEDQTSGDGSKGGDYDFQFKQSRPSGLMITQSPVFSVPPGLSPVGLLDSPGQGPFGMTHQQVLAQVTARAAQGHPNMHIQTDYSTSISAAPSTSLTQLPAFTTSTTTCQEMPSLVPDSSIAVKESSDVSQPDQRSQSSSFTVDKPNDDGYNWRKYGQKQVKGSEFPRSYYKCTHPSCPVKKKVERSLDGQVTEIIYKGQHNHQRPPPNKRAKDVGNPNGNLNIQGNPTFTSQVHGESVSKSNEGSIVCSLSRKEQESSQATHDQISGTSDSEEVGDAETGVAEKDEDEPEPKRRSTEVRYSEPASSHRTVAEPRIIVQTTSEVDLLDDGYRWRKYGQKVVKGNPYPRSYYKCTTPDCNVRKHVERASTDIKAVITTYEGKHNHDVPAAKTSSHHTANNNASNQRFHNTGTQNHGSFNKMGLSNNDEQPIGRLRLKEEQIT